MTALISASSVVNKVLIMLGEGILSFSVILWSILTFFTLFQIRKYIKGRQCSDDISAEGKIAVITGANSGIGRQLAKELNLRGAKVYLLCRDKDKGIRAIDELAEEGCDITRLLLKLVDLSDFSTIHKFAYEIQRHVDKIDILVNNAAIMYYPNFTKTVNGHELTWQTNYLGHFLLTELLLPLLKKSWNGRIINISCDLHKYAEDADGYKMDESGHFHRFRRYCRTKLAAVMHARELARRIRETDPTSTVVINACHPGFCYTGLLRYTAIKYWPIKILLLPFLWFFLKSGRDGAQTPLYMSLSKQLENDSGKYYADCEEVEPAKSALDSAACEQLYNYSLTAVNLDDAVIDLQNGKRNGKMANFY